MGWRIIVTLRVYYQAIAPSLMYYAILAAFDLL